MELLLGVDIGSTTVKLVVLDPETDAILHSTYQRHNASQGSCVLQLLDDVAKRFPGKTMRTAFCGSAGQSFAEATGGFFIQEVVANTLAVKRDYPDVRMAIELGGQDAKVIFFTFDQRRKQLVASDMRMNGSCAGGTGAFIDQVAELLNIKTEQFNDYAMRGSTEYEISGRCGVFAKTDIQPLLNQGVSKEDVALSSFHALAKQTIGGLAQGMKIEPKVIFEGGPLTFNPRLISVFQQRLGLSDEQIIVPEHPEILVAYGAALSLKSMFADYANDFDWDSARKSLEDIALKRHLKLGAGSERFFQDGAQKEDFYSRHQTQELLNYEPKRGETVRAYLGIDAGSTTSKFVLLSEDETPLHRFYSSNKGEPIDVVIQGLKDIQQFYQSRGAKLEIIAAGTTGYGEKLFAAALKADYHTVETVAHTRAARQYLEDVSFILDIGGQDMKAISLNAGIVSGIVLNEACSAGCGSFVETYARSLGVAVGDIAELAFDAEHASRLGSRCTVFMNSSIITEQKQGKTSADILAGICRSIIENVFTKVVRISNLDQLGPHIMVQGGTFKNDAVLRALEQYIGRDVVRAPYPGEMGAIGIALLTKEHVEHQQSMGQSLNAPWSSSFIGLNSLDDFSYKKTPGVVCRWCTNNCMRTVVEFSDGSSYVTGNRCERGEIVGDPARDDVRKALKAHAGNKQKVTDMMELQNQLLFRKYPVQQLGPVRGITIGLPRTLEFWYSMPFWSSLFRTLGFDLAVSPESSYELFESGLGFVPSDTICFPAKLAHGHVEKLCDMGVDRIFFPQMSRGIKENSRAESNWYCAVIQGYALVSDKSNETLQRHGIPLDRPLFHWFDQRIKVDQLSDYFEQTFGIQRSLVKRAVAAADQVMEAYRSELAAAGAQAMEKLRKNGGFGVLIACRPYHGDRLVNHDLSRHFTRRGIPVFTLDSLPGSHDSDLSGVRMETTINFHTRMVEAAMMAAESPELELVQVVSFGCGHDAVISDEMNRILRERSDKEMLMLKLDEGEAAGPLNIRITSFIETVKSRRELIAKQAAPSLPRRLAEAFPVKFRSKDRKDKEIYLPNLSQAFSYLFAKVMEKRGFRVRTLPLASPRAIELGKKYLHNDICYPAQINVGEFLAELEAGRVDPGCAALGIAKNCEECRAGQYAVLARKALDEAGYPDIPLVTSGTDMKNMHPGFQFKITHQWHLLWGLTIVDALERMRRRIRPYEVEKGSCDHVFDTYLTQIGQVMTRRKTLAMNLLRQAIDDFNAIVVADEQRKPRVGIIGEILMNYHPSANGYIETYLEDHGMEVVVPNMHDFFRKEHYVYREMGKRGHTPHPALDFLASDLTGKLFDYVNSRVQKVAESFRFPMHHATVHNLADNIKDTIDVTYLGGEGWKIPGEIIEMEKDGVNSFIIIQPFGCLPNHITGRGLTKALKQQLPHIQILSLDYDPDTSFANIENRLQMLIINARELEVPALQ